jgi:hypothetical protein
MSQLLSFSRLITAFMLSSIVLATNAQFREETKQFVNSNNRLDEKDAFYYTTETTLELKGSRLRNELFYLDSVPKEKDFLTLYTTIECKMKLVTKNGVDKYAFLNINAAIRDHLKSLGIKITKPDGSVILLDSTQILKHANSTEKDIQTGSDQLKYAIPGAEAGDIISINIAIKEDFTYSQHDGNIFLFSELPIGKSKFIIKVPREFNVFYRLYNNFPEPKILSSDTSICCTFEQENLEPLTEQKYTCYSCDLPYFYFNIFFTKGMGSMDWDQFYKVVYNPMTLPVFSFNSSDNYYNRWMHKVRKSSKSDSKIDQLKMFIKNINDNIEVKVLPNNERRQISGYYLRKGYIDQDNLRILYRKIFEDLKVDYWACFAKNKWMGPMEKYFVRPQEISDLFFMIEEQGKPKYMVYPSTPIYKFQFDEVPTSLYNTTAVIIKPVKRDEKRINHAQPFIMNLQVDSVIVNELNIPKGSYNTNYFRMVTQAYVELTSKKDSFKSSYTFSGGVSTKYRMLFRYLDNNKEVNDFFKEYIKYSGTEPALKVDTVLSRDFQRDMSFKYTVNVAGKFSKGINYINDSTISISLNDIITHDQVDSSPDSIVLDYYLDYAYTDMMYLNILFSKPIEPINLANIDKQIANEVGEYACKLVVIDNNAIAINSTYKIFKDIIKTGDYHSLQDINNLLQQTRNAHILLRIR